MACVVTLRSSDRSDGESSNDCLIPLQWPQVFNNENRRWSVAVKRFMIPGVVSADGGSLYTKIVDDMKDYDGYWGINTSNVGVPLTSHIELRLHFLGSADVYDTNRLVCLTYFIPTAREAISDSDIAQVVPSMTNAHSDLWFPMTINASPEVRAELLDADGNHLMYSIANATDGIGTITPPNFVVQLEFKCEQ